MANITFGSGLNGSVWLEDFYDMKTLKLVSKTATKAVYRDANGDEIVLTGKEFSFSGNFATKGTVTGVDFIAGSDEKYLTFTKANFDASKIFAKIKEGDFFNLLTRLTSGKDVITGTNSDEDIIIGLNAGNDTILGKGGDDYIKGGPGSKIIDGGSGWDTLTYDESYWDKANATKGIVLNVTKGTVTNSWGGTDQIKNFESYRGSHHADNMVGSAKDEGFMGMAGNDYIDGGKGWDELQYARDQRFGGTKGIVVDLAAGKIKDGFGNTDTVKNIEAVFGTLAVDTFKGNASDNQFRGFGGKDSYDGGGGSDTLAFYWWEDHGQKGATVDLRKTTDNVINDGFGNKETAKSIENLEGTDFADNFILGKSDGYAYGRGGNDRLVAGAGENWLEGGSGADKFVFLKATDSAKGTTTRDFIDDFSRAQGDKIDLSAFDGLSFAKHVKTMVNTAGDTIVTVNVAGSTDLQFLINGDLALKATDFIF